MRFHPQPVVALHQSHQRSNNIHSSSQSNLNFITQENGNGDPTIDVSLDSPTNPTVNLIGPNDLLPKTITTQSSLVFHQSTQNTRRQTTTQEIDYTTNELDTNYDSRRSNFNSTQIYNNLNELSNVRTVTANNTASTGILNNHHQQPPINKVKLRQNDNDLKRLNGNNCNIVISDRVEQYTLNGGGNHGVDDNEENGGQVNADNKRTVSFQQFFTNICRRNKDFSIFVFIFSTTKTGE